MQVKHRRLQLGQLDGRDADGPDVAQLVVAAVLLHRRYFWSHPGQSRDRDPVMNQNYATTKPRDDLRGPCR